LQKDVIANDDTIVERQIVVQFLRVRFIQYFFQRDFSLRMMKSC